MRRGGMPRASQAMRLLGWWALDYLYAAAWQGRAVFDGTKSDAYLTGDAAPVVIVPGVYEPWRFMKPLIESVHALGHPVHVLEPLGFNSRPVPEAAEKVARYLERQGLSDVILVTHSKGGLVGKYVMSLGEGAARIRGMLAVATPFGGSKYARRIAVPSLRVFAPDDATIVALAQEARVNSRIVSVYARFDPHIPEGSRLEGARNVEVRTGGHFRILAHPRIVREFAALAAEDRSL